MRMAPAKELSLVSNPGVGTRQRIPVTRYPIRDEYMGRRFCPARLNVRARVSMVNAMVA